MDKPDKAQESTPHRKFGELWFAVAAHSYVDVLLRKAKTDGWCLGTELQNELYACDKGLGRMQA